MSWEVSLKVPVSPKAGHSNELKGADKETYKETYRETYRGASCLSRFCHACCQPTVGDRIKKLCQLLTCQFEPGRHLVSLMKLHSPCHSLIIKKLLSVFALHLISFQIWRKTLGMAGRTSWSRERRSTKTAGLPSLSPTLPACLSLASLLWALPMLSTGSKRKT